MHKYVHFDGQIVQASGAAIPAVTNAALYGKGVFTTLAIYDGQPFIWKKHWRRLCENGNKISIDLSAHSEENVRTRLGEILEKNKVANSRARITFFDGSSGKIWADEKQPKTTLLITTGEFRPLNEDLRLTISAYRINTHSPLTGVKSCNYLDKMLALDEAKARGFDEAIQINERGFIVSAIMANVFWLKDSTLYTPTLKSGCLAGTTRELVLENMHCEEVEETIETLYSAEHIFLTSAGLGVVEAKEFSKRKLETVHHPILDLLPKRR